MKCNLKEIALMSDGPCVIEGRLNYKRTSNGAIREAVFKERWFRLIKNHLFYFKLSELGKFDTRSPAGVLVLENSSVLEEHGHTIPFVFSLCFVDEPDKRHVLAARTQESAARWTQLLRASSYEYLRSRLHLLQSQIYSISGSDPLLLVPRNDGAKLWAPSVPFSTAPACSSSSAGFSCHLHTHTRLYTLDRIQSDFYVATHSSCVTSSVQSEANPTRDDDPGRSRKEMTRNANVNGTNSTRCDVSITVKSSGEDKIANLRLDDIDKSEVPLERSKTVMSIENRLNPFDRSIFDSGSPYTRPAPSPPVRKKSSPRLNRNNTDSLLERSRCLGSSSILEPVPRIPPRRKISPKCLEVSREGCAGGEGLPAMVSGLDEADDLIKF